MGLHRGDVLLHALPIYHVHGLFVACHCALLSGSRMLWLPTFDAKEVIELLPHATVMMGVPTFYTRLLSEPGFGAASLFATMRLFISGSAPLLPETFSEFRATHRARDSRALRHERDGNEHLEPARRRAHLRKRGAAAARSQRARRRRRGRRPCAPGRGRRHRGQRLQRLRRLLAHAREDAGGVHRRRLFQDRRHGRDACPTAISRSSGAPRT